MSSNHSSWALFLGFLAAVFFILSITSGWIVGVLGVIGLSGLIVAVIKFLVALIGVLGFLVLGLYLLKRAWDNRG